MIQILDVTNPREMCISKNDYYDYISSSTLLFFIPFTEGCDSTILILCSLSIKLIFTKKMFFSLPIVTEKCVEY